ncbi:hypothetical protein JG687_00012220 [Phytophthora cactorum]|uniref:ATP-dependent DNA helicase n=1 Tax=Phytophthora cactorum TaxID=29920 RepID=A0A8T1U2A7_9STRA|nr:hypothetical protein JG687_00012220 [Phytophthora cactorum]
MDENLRSAWDFEADENTILDISALDPASCPTWPSPDLKIVSMLDLFSRHDILQNAAEKTVRIGTSTGMLVDNLLTIEKWVRAEESDNSILSTDTNTITAMDTQVIELLDTSLLGSSMEWHAPTAATFCRSPYLHQRFATIFRTSREYTLNERQHYALMLIGRPFLSRWRHAENLVNDCADLTSILRYSQLLLFLGGGGGTGKSHIVDVVQALCKSWGRSRSLIKTVLTGKAATLTNGRTLASFPLQLMKQRAGDAITEVELVIIDEVSMMKKYQLSQLDTRLHAATRMPDGALGGVHIVLVGDFLQLPEPLYADPARRSHISVAELEGYNLWQQFLDVIMLKENVQF